MPKRVYTQTFGVAGAIIEKDGKILLVRENNIKKPDHGKWNNPAGWIDVGEPPVKACEREVKEETGLDFKAAGLIGVYSLYRKDLEKIKGEKLHHPIKLVFHGKIVGGELMKPNDEISDLKWFAPEEIYRMSPDVLRDLDIKQAVRDYLAGKSYPLEMVCHTVSE